MITMEWPPCFEGSRGQGKGLGLLCEDRLTSVVQLFALGVTGTVCEQAGQAGMSVEWWGHSYFDAGMGRGDPADDRRQIALEVDAQGQEIGNHGDVVDTLGDEDFGSLFERGSAEFEERNFIARYARLTGGFGGNDADGLVGGLHAGAVSEENYALHG